MSRLLGSTLLLTGLSLTVSSEPRAQEAFTKEAQRSEEPTELKPREPSPDTSSARPLAQTVTAASLGTAGGIVGGYVGGVIVCEVAGFGGGVWGMDCLVNTVVVGGSVLTGIAGGYLGYQNNKPVVTLGGALTGIGAGMILWLPANNDDLLLPVMLLSGGAGGYLGYRLWKVREASGARYSVSPYWAQERSGLMVFGEF